MECSIYVSLIKLIYSGAQVTLSLLIFGQLDLSVTDRDVLKAPSIIVYLSILPSVLLVIASCTWRSFVRYIHVYDFLCVLEKLTTFYYYVISLFIHDNLSCSAICFVFKTVTPGLFWLMLACYILFHLFILVQIFIFKVAFF